MAGKLLTHASGATTIREHWEILAPTLDTAVHVRSGAAPVVAVHGELDLAGADAFERLVAEVILRHGPDVVIDGSGVTFCDARGLGALVRCANEAQRSGGRLTLSDPAQRLRRLVRIVGLDHLM